VDRGEWVVEDERGMTWGDGGSGGRWGMGREGG
jgi:hypothetical protein